MSRNDIHPMVAFGQKEKNAGKKKNTQRRKEPPDTKRQKITGLVKIPPSEASHSQFMSQPFILPSPNQQSQPLNQPNAIITVRRVEWLFLPLSTECIYHFDKSCLLLRDKNFYGGRPC